jgi:hypothetical protein
MYGSGARIGLGRIQAADRPTLWDLRRALSVSIAVAVGLATRSTAAQRFATTIRPTSGATILVFVFVFAHSLCGSAVRSYPLSYRSRQEGKGGTRCGEPTRGKQRGAWQRHRGRRLNKPTTSSVEANRARHCEEVIASVAKPSKQKRHG